MATVYGKVNDQAADPSVEPTDVAVDIGAQDGVLGSSYGASSDAGGTVILPNFGVAGAVATIDDEVYTDTDDGLVGSASRFFPGSGYAQGYQNEAFAREGAVTEGPNVRTALEPVGVTDDVETVMGL